MCVRQPSVRWGISSASTASLSARSTAGRLWTCASFPTGLVSCVQSSSRRTTTHFPVGEDMAHFISAQQCTSLRSLQSCAPHIRRTRVNALCIRNIVDRTERRRCWPASLLDSVEKPSKTSCPRHLRTVAVIASRQLPHTPTRPLEDMPSAWVRLTLA